MTTKLSTIREVQAQAKLLVSEAELMLAFDKIAIEIAAKLKDTNPIVLPIMNGALMFTAELMKRLDFPMQLDYVHATRYRGNTIGGDHIHWIKEPTDTLTDRTILIVDDVLDGGQTLHAIVEFCYARGAKQVYTAVALDKPDGRSETGLQQADFTGIAIPNEFVIGFGLDYDGYLRNLSGIYQVAKQHQ